MFPSAIRKFFKKSEDAPVEILLGDRAIMLRLHDGRMVHAAAGTRHHVTLETANDLAGAGDAEIVGEAAARQNRATYFDSLLPPPREPMALPPEWKLLPPSFQKWWELNQRIACARQRHDDILNAYRAACGFRGNGDGQVGLMECSKVPSNAALAERAALLINWVENTEETRIERTPPDSLTTRNYLGSAYQRSAKAVDELVAAERENVWRFQIECSNHCLEAHGALRLVCRELADTAFRIFSVRIESLGLHEDKIRQLFSGSGPCLKYQEPAGLPAIQDLRLLLHEDDGRVQHHYIDVNPRVLADSYGAWTARNLELQKLLEVAKLELSMARSITLPAGLPA